MKILGLIPARSGSKGIPDKNIKLLAGKSLIQLAFECAIASEVIDKIVLSTDSPRIAEIACRFGLESPFLRPSDLATDKSAMIDVAVHTLKAVRVMNYEPDILLLLQPTSPLRQPKHIQEAVHLLGENDSVCSVVPMPKDMCPHYVMKVKEDGFLDYFMPDGASFTRRQDVPQAYKRDGTIFLTRTSVILEKHSFYGERCVPLIIPAEESLNIDIPAEWEEAEHKLGVSV